MSEREDELEQQTIELHFKQAMHNIKKEAFSGLAPDGCCHNCLEAIDSDKLFCDSDCELDYRKRKKAEQQRRY